MPSTGFISFICFCRAVQMRKEMTALDALHIMYAHPPDHGMMVDYPETWLG